MDRATHRSLLLPASRQAAADLSSYPAGRAQSPAGIADRAGSIGVDANGLCDRRLASLQLDLHAALDLQKGSIRAGWLLPRLMRHPFEVSGVAGGVDHAR